MKIATRLKSRQDIHLLSLPAERRRDPALRRELLNQADLAILCLPDGPAKNAVGLINNHRTKIIDASTAHRVAPGWVYGLPELHGQRDLVSSTTRISNPGCYPTGFVLLLRPLIDAELVPRAYPVVTYAITGYTGGGREMISAFEGAPVESQHELACRPKDLNLTHKHLPEMQVMTRLQDPPHFLPIVGNFRQGMLLFVPLHSPMLAASTTAASIHRALRAYYAGERFIRVMPLNDDGVLVQGFLSPQECNESNRAELFVYQSQDRILLVARLDNLGKGASGAAVQNMSIALGLREDAGLE